MRDAFKARVTQGKGVLEENAIVVVKKHQQAVIDQWLPVYLSQGVTKTKARGKVLYHLVLCYIKDYVTIFVHTCVNYLRVLPILLLTGFAWCTGEKIIFSV